MSLKPLVAILGGSGALGSGIALHLLRRKYDVIIGSRVQEKAVEIAAELSKAAGGGHVRGMSNRAAAEAGEIVMLTVPFSNHASSIDEIKNAVQGKIFVDVTVPLVPPRVSRVNIPPGGSAAAAAQQALGAGVRVVSAFHNVAAAHLHDLSHRPDCDILVFGNDKSARGVIVQMAEDIGLKAWHAGPIENSVVAEALTSVLIFINKNYSIDGAGIRLTGTGRT